MPTCSRTARVAAARGPDHASAASHGAETDELVDRYQQVATHLSRDPHVRARRRGDRPTSRSVLAAPATAPAGARSGTGRASSASSTDRFPAALYRLRGGGGMTAAERRRRHRGDDRGGCCTTPSVGAAPADPEGGRPARQPRLRRLLQPVRRHALRRRRSGPTTPGSTALCLAVGVLGLPVVYLLFQNVANLALIGSIMIRHGHGAGVLGTDPAARAARADRRLRRRRGRAAAVLVLGRAGRADQGASRSRTRAGRPGTSRMGLVVVLLVSGCIEAFVTPSPLPTWARIGIGVLAEAAFLAYVFVLGRRAYAPAGPATSTPHSSRTGSPPGPRGLPGWRRSGAGEHRTRLRVRFLRAGRAP